MGVRQATLLGWIMLGLAACGPKTETETDVVATPAETAAPAATPAAAPSVAAAPAGKGATPVPIPPGFYADNTTCAVALQHPLSGVVIDATYLGDIDADYRLLPVEDLGGGKFKLGEAFEVIRQVGPKTFIANEGKEYERKLEWCADKRP